MLNTVSVHFINVNFTGNHASELGGGLYVDCSPLYHYPCNQISVENTTFTNNTSGKEGGGIKWTYYEPQFMGVKFNGNQAAVYGDNIASVAKWLVKIDYQSLSNRTIVGKVNQSIASSRYSLHDIESGS